MEEKFDENFLENDGSQLSTNYIDWYDIMNQNQAICVHEKSYYFKCLNDKKNENKCKQLEFILTKCIEKHGLIIKT